LFEQTDLGPFPWTNLVYVVQATGTNSVIQFQFRNDENAFGLDDVVLTTTGSQEMATLTVIASPTEAGTVNGNGIYTVGSEEQISATAAPGWIFTGWSDGNQDNPRAVTVPAAGATYTANFLATSDLTVRVEPGEGGAASGNGTYLVGSEQQIAAVAFPGWTFVGWSDGSQENPRAVTITTTGATYTATFATTAELIVRGEPAEGGTASGSGIYPVGSQQQIAANAAPGWSFAQWNDGNLENPRVLTVVAGGATYIATFQSAVQPAQLTIALSSSATLILNVMISGTIGVSYVLQTSSDLATWTDVQAVTITAAGTAQATISAASTSTAFFRVVRRN
jgi:hypothetical protein